MLWSSPCTFPSLSTLPKKLRALALASVWKFFSSTKPLNFCVHPMQGLETLSFPKHTAF